jgi:hypothetical protein
MQTVEKTNIKFGTTCTKTESKNLQTSAAVTYSLNQTKDLSIYDGKRSIPAAFTVFSDIETEKQRAEEAPRLTSDTVWGLATENLQARASEPCSSWASERHEARWAGPSATKRER